MRVPSSSFSTSLISEIQTLNAQQAKYQQQLSSGQSITNPSDAPATVGHVINMDAELQTLQQLSSNNGTATEITQQSYSALSSLKDITTTASQLAINGANGTTSSTSYQAYSQQLKQLLNQGLATANTQYNGQYLFGGTQTNTPPFTATRDASGNITGVTYTGTASGIKMLTGEGSSTSPYTDGATNQGIADYLNNLVALQSAMSAGSATAVQAAQPALQSGEDTIISAVSGVGAVQAGLQADESLNTAKFTSLQKLISSATSTDVATASVQLTQAQTAYQAALETGAKILQTSLLNYIQ